MQPFNANKRYLEILKEINEYQDHAAKCMMEAQRMKEQVGIHNDVDGTQTAKGNDVSIPFASYEMQLERFLDEKKDLMDRAEKEKEALRAEHENEKKEMRTHYRRLIAWTYIGLMSILLFFAWLFANVDFVDVSQDSDGINNFAGKGAQQGDIVNEPTYTDNLLEAEDAEVPSGEQEEYWNPQH